MQRCTQAGQREFGARDEDAAYVAQIRDIPIGASAGQQQIGTLPQPAGRA